MKFFPKGRSIAGRVSIKAVFLGFALSLSGCLSAPTIHSPEEVPPYVRQIKYLRIYQHEKQLDTGIDVSEGENFSVMGTGTLVHRYANYIKKYPSSSLKIWTKNQDQFFPLLTSSGATFGSDLAGRLYLGVNPLLSDYVGYFDVAIVVWKTNEYTKIFEFLSILNSKAPDHIGINHALIYAKAMAGLLALQDKTSKEIESTSKEIEELRQKGAEAESPAGAQRRHRIQALEKRVSELSGKLADLEAKKKELLDAQQLTSALSRELDEKERREADLISKSTGAGGRPPLLLITSPAEGIQTSSKTVLLTGVAEDALGLERIEIYVNKQVEDQGGPSRIVYGDKNPAERISFDLPLTLVQGGNRIRVQAINTGGLVAEKIIFVDQVPSRPNIWAVVIGINDYPKLPRLKYAVRDATEFYRLLVERNKISPANITMLLNEQATLSNLRSALGTQLKTSAEKDDMVVIFFAGHGATERDASSADGDGLEKYLLTWEADLKDLYSTAIPTREMAHIFGRIQSERLVFIADACYSGASGGRTVSVTGMRSGIHDGFLDRIASGKGKIILSASAANEVSVEKDELKHGVFTFYLLEGLNGLADTDADGAITVDEVYRYVSEKVPRATGQEQHPVKKGFIEGSLILSVPN
jgi:hypothetical protein